MKIVSALIMTLLLTLPALSTRAMNTEGCGAGSCNECHTLTVKEAEKLLKRGNFDRILSVEFSEMPGVWVVEVKKDDKTLPLYVDFSKSYIVAGNIIRLKDGRNITTSHIKTKPKVVDVAKIPVEDALVLGRADAPTKVIVFTDPQCPYCRKLHDELKKVVKSNPDIAFLIKLFPLKMHPDAYSISKSILCKKSLPMLEASLAKEPVPPPTCETPIVDQTLALGRKLGINSTPTMILPDGRILPGSRPAEEILQLLEGGAAEAKAAH